jgi:hypothetical protein
MRSRGLGWEAAARSSEPPCQARKNRSRDAERMFEHGPLPSQALSTNSHTKHK